MPAPNEGHDEVERTDATRMYSGSALRTLHALERTLRRHIDELMKVGCEDADAAEAIVFAIESAEKALTNVSVVRRRVLDAGRSPGDAEE